MTYAIVDVRVSHGEAGGIEQLRAAGYKPLVENGCVSPTDPTVISRVEPADVNKGIGGDTVSIWVKYEILPPDSPKPVLTDIRVERWPNWNARCPAGYQGANGDPRLTTKTKGACNDNGLCVKYEPLRTASSAIVTSLYLSRANNAIAALACGGSPCPGNEGNWKTTASGDDIHKGCGDGVWVYVCRNQEARAIPAAPKDFASVTATQKLALMKAYAPRIYLAKDEKYFPSDVEWSFANTVRFKNSDGRYWLQTKEPLTTLFDTLDYWSGYSDVARAPVYAFWIDKSAAVSGPAVDLVYFTYYPYNLGKPLMGVTWGNHVGDWEHLTVRLAWSYEGSAWTIAPPRYVSPNTTAAARSAGPTSRK